MVPEWLVYDHRIQPRAKQIWMFLRSLATVEYDNLAKTSVRELAWHARTSPDKPLDRRGTSKALDQLESIGLIERVPGRTETSSWIDPTTGKRSQVEHQFFEVYDEPFELAGPTSFRADVQAVEGGSGGAARRGSLPARKVSIRSAAQNSRDGADQSGWDSGPTPRDSGPHGWDSGPTPRDYSPASAALTTGNGDPHSSSRSLPEVDHFEPSDAALSGTSAPVDNSAASDARAEEESREEPKNEARGSVVARALGWPDTDVPDLDELTFNPFDDPTLYAAAIVVTVETDLRRIGAWDRQVVEIVRGVESMLLRYDVDRVETWVRSKAKRAKVATYLVEAVTTYADGISHERTHERKAERERQAKVTLEAVTGGGQTTPPQSPVLAPARPPATLEPQPESESEEEVPTVDPDVLTSLGEMQRRRDWLASGLDDTDGPKQRALRRQIAQLDEHIEARRALEAIIGDVAEVAL